MEQEHDLILGAGGILWQHKPFRSAIAVIHRRRYGDEWCLPKGKQKAEDRGSIERTAIREMKEETHCRARIAGFAGMTEYAIDGSKKQVFYWHMRLSGKCSFEPSEEVDQLLWLPPAEAMKILTHADQREMMKIAMVPSFRPRTSFYPGFSGTSKFHRLAGSVMSYRVEIANRCDSSQNPLEKANELLRKAEAASQYGDLDEGWKCFHAAQRMEIFCLNAEELKSKAQTIVNEAEKLSSWRKGAVEGLLGTAASLKEPLTRDQVYQAALVRDEHYNNTAYKDALLRNHMGILVALASALIALVAVGLVAETMFGYNLIPIVGVALFGLLGGTYSAVLKVPPSAVSSRIPELSHSLRLTLLRVLVGAASAILLFEFLQSDFLGSLFEVGMRHKETYYVIAFVSGFSERLVLKAVSVVGRE
jgi:8-oxo-dGTP diphosphatase